LAGLSGEKGGIHGRRKVFEQSSRYFQGVVKKNDILIGGSLGLLGTVLSSRASTSRGKRCIDKY
jgi:hypothetical protein